MTQNTPTIYQRLEKLEGELQKLTNTVYALKVTDIQNYDQNFEEPVSYTHLTLPTT